MVAVLAKISAAVSTKYDEPKLQHLYFNCATSCGKHSTLSTRTQRRHYMCCWAHVCAAEPTCCASMWLQRPKNRRLLFGSVDWAKIGSVQVKKLGCGFFVHSRSFVGGDLQPPNF